MPPAPLLHPTSPSASDLTAFFDRHEHLLSLERSADEEQTRLLNSNCSPRLLEQRGLALGGLGVGGINIGLGGKNLIELVRPLAYHTSVTLPPHTFRNGDPVRIEAHVTSQKGKGKKKAEDEDGAVEGIVYRVSADKVVVAVDGAKEVDLPERLRLLKLANSVTFDRMERTLTHLRRLVLPSDTGPTPSATNLPLINSLLGIQEPTWRRQIPPTIAQLADDPTATSGEIEWLGENLNPSQKEAIGFCLAAEQVACIHGPPGTGKTHTLIELIFQLLLRPASSSSSSSSKTPPRILITTPSNLALDNILLRLHALCAAPPFSDILPRSAILRLGHPTRVHRDLVGATLDYRAANGEEGELLRDVGKEIEGHLGDLGRKRGEKGAVKGRERGKRWEEVRELRKEYRQREGKVVTNVVGRAQVVLATCHSAGSRQLNNVQFDVAIVDEATQAVEAVCWVPILKAKRLILAGDPQQLPPTILSRGDKVKVQGKSGGQDKSESKSAEAAAAAASIVNKVNIAAEAETVAEANGEDESDTLDRDPIDPTAGALSKLSVKSQSRSRLRPPRTLETTLFDRLESLYGDGIKRVLKVQYRMNEHIASFPSSELYDGALISAESVAQRTLRSLPTIEHPESEDAKDTLDPTVVFFDTNGCEFYERTEGEEEAGKQRGVSEGSKSNENEAEVVVTWAKKLISLGVPPGDIAVVTPYQSQVSLISSLIHDTHPEMTIGSVDGLQGQEREAIILSLVRSNAKAEVGFLGEYRRLNVAMTRAKRQLCVVGDSGTVGKGSKYLREWIGWLEENADVRWAGDEV